jgi:hypothetical protein
VRLAHLSELGWLSQMRGGSGQQELALGSQEVALPGGEGNQPLRVRSRGKAAPKPKQGSTKLNGKRSEVPVRGARPVVDAGPQPDLRSLTPGARLRGMRHVMARCPACGFEAQDKLEPYRSHSDAGLPSRDAGTCPVCTTPMRWWCEAHSMTIGWLEEPVCLECAVAPFLEAPGTKPGSPGIVWDHVQAEQASAQPWLPTVGAVEIDSSLRVLDPEEEPTVHMYRGTAAARPGTSSRDLVPLHGTAYVPQAEGDAWLNWGNRLLVACLSMTPGAALVYQGRASWLAIPAALAGPLALHAVRQHQELTMVLGVVLGALGFWILSRTALVLALVIVILGSAGLVLRDRRIAALLLLLLVSWMLAVPSIPVRYGGLLIPEGAEENWKALEEGR